MNQPYSACVKLTLESLSFFIFLPDKVSGQTSTLFWILVELNCVLMALNA